MPPGDVQHQVLQRLRDTRPGVPGEAGQQVLHAQAGVERAPDCLLGEAHGEGRATGLDLGGCGQQGGQLARRSPGDDACQVTLQHNLVDRRRQGVLECGGGVAALDQGAARAAQRAAADHTEQRRLVQHGLHRVHGWGRPGRPPAQHVQNLPGVQRAVPGVVQHAQGRAAQACHPRPPQLGVQRCADHSVVVAGPDEPGRPFRGEPRVGELVPRGSNRLRQPVIRPCRGRDRGRGLAVLGNEVRRAGELDHEGRQGVGGAKVCGQSAQLSNPEPARAQHRGRLGAPLRDQGADQPNDFLRVPDGVAVHPERVGRDRGRYRAPGGLAMGASAAERKSDLPRQDDVLGVAGGEQPVAQQPLDATPGGGGGGVVGGARRATYGRAPGERAEHPSGGRGCPLEQSGHGGGVGEVCDHGRHLWRGPVGFGQAEVHGEPSERCGRPAGERRRERGAQPRGIGPEHVAQAGRGGQRAGR